MESSEISSVPAFRNRSKSQLFLLLALSVVSFVWGTVMAIAGFGLPPQVHSLLCSTPLCVIRCVGCLISMIPAIGLVLGIRILNRNAESKAFIATTMLAVQLVIIGYFGGRSTTDSFVNLGAYLVFIVLLLCWYAYYTFTKRKCEKISSQKVSVARVKAFTFLFMVVLYFVPTLFGFTAPALYYVVAISGASLLLIMSRAITLTTNEQFTFAKTVQSLVCIVCASVCFWCATIGLVRTFLLNWQY